jgi:hypothetical protein
MTDVLVLGERFDDVGDELVGFDVEWRDDGRAEVTGRMSADGALMRALCRAEAELLLADADAMAAGTYRGRTPDQRRADAFVLVAERLGEAAQSMASATASRHHRGNKASNRMIRRSR